MAEAYLSEIRIFGFNFAPRGWATCDGQILPINQNQAIFSLLGTTYGGDGRTSFGLPDLRGRVPFHFDNIFTQGSRGGAPTHTLNVTEMPAHTHSIIASSAAASQSSPAGNLWAKGAQAPGYSNTATGTMASASISNTGGSQAHENMMPYLALNICIALQGIFPSRN